MPPSQPAWSYRVDHGPGYFLPHLGLLVFPVCFGIGAAGSHGGERVALFVVAAVVAAPLGLALWLTVHTWNDQLTIYPEGFEYLRRGRAQTHTWDDIADLTYAEEPGRRLVASTVYLRDGGVLRFTRRLRGLDLLGQEYANTLRLEREEEEPDEEEPDAEEPDAEEVSDQGLGPLEGTYRVRIRFPAVFVIALVGVPAVLILLFVLSYPGVTSVICFAPFGILTAVFVWELVADRNDELTVYRNGFTYRDRKGLQQCLWEEIEDFRTTTRQGSLTAFKKMDGPWINFASWMTGIDKLEPHRRRVIRWVERPDGRSWMR
jgi:hypothetical protein